MEKSQEIEKAEYRNNDEVKPETSPTEWQDDPRVKRIKRKVDWRLSLILAFMYAVNQIDRNNLGIAVVAGMDKDLNLIGYRFNIIILVFFPTYIIFNPIATVIARKLGPRPFLSGITAAFGLLVIGFGLAKNWTTQVGLRVVLGALESCFFPSAIFLVAMWYTRREVMKRVAFFYLFGNSVGGFGGILAYGLQQMAGVGGHPGWAWIFIWEGILTIVIAIASYILLVDFPEQAHRNKFFLSSEELQIMIDRVDRDRGDAHVTPFDIKKYLAYCTDWKIWLFCGNFGLGGVVTYSVAYFLPIILLNTLEFSVAKSQCLTAPCYIFSFVLGCSEAWLSDKLNLRGPFLIFNGFLQIIGIAVLGFASQPYVRYFGAFLVTGGVNANIPATITYQANNVVGQWKRALTNGILVAFGALGGIIGTVTFREQDSPNYIPGLITCFCAAGLLIVSVSTTTVYMLVQNRKQAQGKLMIEGVEGFRYTL